MRSSEQTRRGARIPRGIDWQPSMTHMFDVEHGPGADWNSEWHNSGWPPIRRERAADGMGSPLSEWPPGIVSSSGGFCRGETLGVRRGNLLVGGPKSNRAFRTVLDGDKVISRGMLVDSPDWLIYFATSNKDGRGMPNAEDDRIFRMVPAE
ncbi:MAG: PQQ-dependent sugar dehydrogenase [Phycisphaerales bacterium]